MPESDELSAMMCEHANEVPLSCPCSEDCYCKSHTCAPRLGMTCVLHPDMRHTIPAIEDGGWPATPAAAGFTADEYVPSDDYSELRRILAEAVEQASQGKGKERHAVAGERFEEQQIVMLSRWLGSNHGDLFQAIKKSIESTRLPKDRAKQELLGAINYLAAAVILLEQGK